MIAEGRVPPSAATNQKNQGEIMERAVTARPRGSFAPAQALLADVCQASLAAMPGLNTSTLHRIQLAIGGSLAACAVFEAARGSPAYAALLLAGALVSFLTARTHAEPADQVGADQAAARPADLTSEIILQLATQTAADRKVASATALSPEAWSDLMARVSHDLRTPLNAVIGFSDVMGSELFGPVGDDRYREYIAHIRESGRELLKSAEDTLAITALLGGDRTSAGTRASLEAVARDVAAIAPGFTCEIDDAVEVLCERRSLRQALVNLVSEASLRAGPAARPCLSATCEDEFVIVEVSVDAAASNRPACEAPLHICIARVLLELQGAKLIEIEQDGQWRAVTVLSRAAQHDFFASGTVAMGWRPQAPRHITLPV